MEFESEFVKNHVVLKIKYIIPRRFCHVVFANSSQLSGFYVSKYFTLPFFVTFKDCFVFCSVEIIPAYSKGVKILTGGVWSGENLQTCWNWILRHIADNIISVSSYVPVSIPAFLLTISFWLHVMSVPTSFYRTLRGLRKLNLSHLKLVLALLYNYSTIEGKADRAAISVGNLFAPIFWLDKTSLHQGLEKLISWWRLVLSSWNIGQINYQHLAARSALPSPFCWSWSTPRSGCCLSK